MEKKFQDFRSTHMLCSKNRFALALYLQKRYDWHFEERNVMHDNWWPFIHRIIMMVVKLCNERLNPGEYSTTFCTEWIRKTLGAERNDSRKFNFLQACLKVSRNYRIAFGCQCVFLKSKFGEDNDFLEVYKFLLQIVRTDLYSFFGSYKFEQDFHKNRIQTLGCPIGVHRSKWKLNNALQCWISVFAVTSKWC